MEAASCNSHRLVSYMYKHKIQNDIALVNKDKKNTTTTIFVIQSIRQRATTPRCFQIVE